MTGTSLLPPIDSKNSCDEVDAAIANECEPHDASSPDDAPRLWHATTAIIAQVVVDDGPGCPPAAALTLVEGRGSRSLRAVGPG